MSVQLVYVGLFLAVFAFLPLILKKVMQKMSGEHSTLFNFSKVVSTVGLGQNQRVVTVEVGPENRRLLLVLGVSAQGIICLHKFEADSPIRLPILDPKDPIVQPYEKIS